MIRNYAKLLEILGTDDYETIQKWYEEVTSYEFNNSKIKLTGNRLIDERDDHI